MKIAKRHAAVAPMEVESLETSHQCWHKRRESRKAHAVVGMEERSCETPCCTVVCARKKKVSEVHA